MKWTKAKFRLHARPDHNIIPFKIVQSLSVVLCPFTAGSHAQLPARRKPPERPPPPYSLRSPASKAALEVQPDYGRCPSIPAQKSPHIIVSTSPKKPGSPLQSFPIPPVLLEQCKKLMPHWHKPQLSREEAVSYLLDKDPGCFVIRDSTTVTGGYALTVRMSLEEAKARARRRLSKGSCKYRSDL